jgi:hypothetical protein
MSEPRKPRPRLTEKERHYRELLDELAASGKTLGEFAAERGIPSGTLSWWKGEVKRRAARRSGRPVPKRRKYRRKVPFVPVTVTQDAGTGLSAGVFEVSLPGGAAVRVPPGFDDGAFRRLVTVLKETC